jgi:hypothetical protein
VLKLHTNLGSGGMDAFREMLEAGDESIIVESGKPPVS